MPENEYYSKKKKKSVESVSKRERECVCLEKECRV